MNGFIARNNIEAQTLALSTIVSLCFYSLFWHRNARVAWRFFQQWTFTSPQSGSRVAKSSPSNRLRTSPAAASLLAKYVAFFAWACRCPPEHSPRLSCLQSTATAIWASWAAPSSPPPGCVKPKLWLKVHRWPRWAPGRFCTVFVRLRSVWSIFPSIRFGSLSLLIEFSPTLFSVSPADWLRGWLGRCPLQSIWRFPE